MVDIIHKPLKEIVVHQYVKYSSPEVLARAIMVQSGAMQPASLNWIDGIVFKIASPPFIMSERLAEEYLQGRLHVSVMYAVMPVFQPSIHAAEEKIQIPILNESSNMEAKTVIDWLKKQI